MNEVKITSELFEALRRYFSYFDGARVEYAEMMALRTYIQGCLRNKVNRQRSRENFLERKFGKCPERCRVTEPRSLSDILAGDTEEE